MGVEYGIEEFKKIVYALAEIFNAVSKVVKGNVFAALGLLEPLNILRSVKFDIFKLEFSDLSEPEREEIEQVFVGALDMADKEVQKKVVESADVINEAASLVEEAIAEFEHAKLLIAKFKAIFGI